MAPSRRSWREVVSRPKPPAPAKDQRQQPKRLPWRAIVLTAACVGILLAPIAVYVSVVWWTLPSLTETTRMAQSVHIHVKKTTRPDGRATYDLVGSEFEYGLDIQLKNISPHFIQAAILTEDHRFYNHGWIYKVFKFFQAAFKCIMIKTKNEMFELSAGCPGNSTITQQLARNLFISQTRTIPRKIKEIIWAVKMESDLSKDDILKYYLNRINLGKRNFGPEIASRAYFNKPASDLDMYEALILAAAIKKPKWNWSQNAQRAKERARFILKRMQERGYESAQRKRIPKNFSPRYGYRFINKPYLKHFYSWIQQGLEEILDREPDGEYKVITTINAEAQIYAEHRLESHVLNATHRNVFQGALVSMRPDGAVLTMVGGVGAAGRMINRAKATDNLIPRPPASTFKPIIYLAALQHSLTLDSMISAHPISIPMGHGLAPYEPQNVDGRTYGMIKFSEGLIKSINTATVRLLYDTIAQRELKNIARLDKLVSCLGIHPSRLRPEWGVALGSQGTPLIEMTTAYSVFANGGQAVQPYGMHAIYNAQGARVWQRRPAPSTCDIPASHISALNRMLVRVLREGTGQRAAVGFSPQQQIAGKTGTGDEFTDAWFIGYSAHLITGVWVGNDRPKPMTEIYGGTIPAAIWNDYMHDIVNNTSLHPTFNDLP